MPMQPSFQPTSIQSAQVTLFSVSQLEQSIISMDTDTDDFMLVRVYYFRVEYFFFLQFVNEFFFYLLTEK